MYRLPADAFEPEFAELLRYWESKRQGERLPARTDIDPLDLSRLLPHLLLFDVVRGDGGVRFKFRVAGTAFSAMIGRDVTGIYLDELGPPDRVAAVISGLSAIVETGRPCFLAGRPTLRSDQVTSVKRLGVPLASDGPAVDMILAVWLVQPHQARTERDPAEGGTPVLLEGD
jgi:hypothetical protein